MAEGPPVMAPIPRLAGVRRISGLASSGTRVDAPRGCSLGSTHPTTRPNLNSNICPGSSASYLLSGKCLYIDT